MLTKDDFETAARKYCELMGLDPDETVQIEGPDGNPVDMSRVQLVLHSGRAHVAWQCAFQYALDRRAEKTPPSNTPENRARNIIQP